MTPCSRELILCHPSTWNLHASMVWMLPWQPSVVGQRLQSTWWFLWLRWTIQRRIVVAYRAYLRRCFHVSQCVPHLEAIGREAVGQLSQLSYQSYLMKYSLKILTVESVECRSGFGKSSCSFGEKWDDHPSNQHKVAEAMPDLSKEHWSL